MVAVAEAYASGVLVEAVHGRLVEDIVNIARDAAIQPKHIWTPLNKTCGHDEVNYVRRFKFHKAEGVFGLVLHGVPKGADVDARMAAIAGALVRNFVQARMVTASRLVEMEEHGSEMVSCLMVPNFYADNMSIQKADWKIAALYDALLSRQQAGMQTVLYVSNLDAMTKDYGAAVRRHLMTHFIFAEIG